MIKSISEMFSRKPAKKVHEASLVTFTPQELAELRRISKQVLEGNAVLLDFSNTSKTLSIRIVDHISGLLMGIGGDYRKIAPKKFLVSRSKELSNKFENDIKKIEI